MTEDFELIRASYPDRDDLVAEIWFKNEMIALIEEDGGIELFKERVDPSVFDDPDFFRMLEAAKKRLGIV